MTDLQGNGCQATPPDELERLIMSPHIPKSEHEWWARQEILRLRSALTAAPASVSTLGKCFECDGELSVWCPECNATSSLGSWGGVSAREIIKVALEWSDCGDPSSEAEDELLARLASACSIYRNNRRAKGE